MSDDVPAKKEKRRTPKQKRYEIAHRPFRRLVRELMFEIRPESAVIRVHPKAMMALQDTTESYIQQLLERSSKCSVQARRITLQAGDVTLAESFGSTAH